MRAVVLNIEHSLGEFVKTQIDGPPPPVFLMGDVGLILSLANPSQVVYLLRRGFLGRVSNTLGLPIQQVFPLRQFLG